MATGIDAWLGRTETQLSVLAVLAVDAVARLSAVLDRNDPLPETGDPAPPLAHWLAFLAADRQSELGPDCHLKRGGFLPAVEHLPRRMWAGSRIRFHGNLPVGVPLQRVSTVADVKLKSGKAGELAFVTVRHEIGAPAAVTDEHDIVYRGAAGETAPMPRPAAEGPWRRTLLPDSVLLFRYSALTFNGHRIHYDRSYARDVEADPGLVVHGPLTATLLADLLRREVPDARVASLAFRAVAPLFDGHAMHLNASGPGADGRIPLWASNHLGEQAMSGEAEFAP